MPGPLERDTCRDHVLPGLRRVGWHDYQIREQYRLAAQRVVSLGGVQREIGSGVADYVLEVAQVPVAVIEAKRAFRAARDGLEQAVRYAQQIDAPLAYATNGAEIIERDMVSGHERIVTEFAPPAVAWNRYTARQALDANAAEMLRHPFNRQKRLATGEVQQPRWYQALAARRVIAAIARGERRVLLLMATGTGKTFTAMQIVHIMREHTRATAPERNFRVLYLADREALVDGPMQNDFTQAFTPAPLLRVGGTTNRNREIYFATYQALATGDESALFRDYREDFFDLVIVDECHRGSAAENSSWRRILEHFSPAVQVGLTATPKQDETADTYGYFGDPVFSYSLRQGIEEGYLAPYRVRRVTLSPDTDGWEPEPGQLDRYSRDIPEGVYGTRDFERVVRLLARTDLAAGYLSRILAPDPTAKMMVFCVDAEHADEMRRSLVNANPERVARDPEWAVRIVGVEGEKKRLLDMFKDPERDSPVIATTSRMLSTGIDVPDLKYVVLFRPVGSSVEFKQIVGRGTRLYPDKGKTSFEIIDFVGATAHFADPDFDGYPVRIIHDPPLPIDPESDTESGTDTEGGADAGSDVDLVAEPEPDFTPGNPPIDGSDSGSPPHISDGRDLGPIYPRAFVVDEGNFFVVNEALLVPDTSSGRLLLTSYGEFVAGQVRLLAPSPQALADQWAHRPTRTDALAALAAARIDVAALLPSTEEEVDIFDMLVQLAWNVPSRTRAERARRVRERHHSELAAKSELARAVLSALLDRYAVFGVDELTSSELLRVPELAALGSSRDIARAFGGAQGLHRAVEELQEWIYSTETG
ncbi:EcoAI/FtnUII family type I restriction enzme subunit R [Nostocoides australiense]